MPQAWGGYKEETCDRAWPSCPGGPDKMYPLWPQERNTNVLFMLFIFFLIYFFWLHQAACGILVSQLGIEPAPSALKAEGLYHQTTREVPLLFLNLGDEKEAGGFGGADFKSLDLTLSQQKEASAQTTTPGAPMRVVCVHHTSCPHHPSDHPSVHVWVRIQTKLPIGHLVLFLYLPTLSSFQHIPGPP